MSEGFNRRYRRQRSKGPPVAGSRVRADSSGWTGTVVRVVCGKTPGSNYVVVKWDATGSSGRHSLTEVTTIKEDE